MQVVVALVSWSSLSSPHHKLVKLHWLCTEPNSCCMIKDSGARDIYISGFMTRIRANSSGMKNVRRSQELDNVGCKIWIFSPGLLLIFAMYVMSSFTEALPFPAPNLQNCRSTEGCCTPVLSNRTVREFKFPGTDKLPLRVRPAAHLVDDDYIAKYQRATELMRALPDTDGRSFLNQYKLHCAYCDNNLYFDDSNSSYPLEIHGSWLFLPWHRWFLFFHERILATLIDDDTFALPFWNWDNQQSPEATVVPRVYAQKRSLAKDFINKTSSLYDPDRTSCARRERGFPEFQNFSACPPFDRDATEVRATNAHLMYMNMVAVGSTPRTFLGAAYRYGDAGGGGGGSLESIPHGSVHGWVNTHDMEEFKDSASDPIFFAHHANLDRLWALWKTLPGGIRDDVPDRDYRDTRFTFYDERGRLVSVSIEQVLNLDPLRYTYEEVPNAWLHKEKRKRKICNRKNSASELANLIETTPAFQGPLNFTRNSLTFKVRRDRKKRDEGEEILELRGDVDWSEFATGDVLTVTAYGFHPAAPMDESMGCAEYLGVRWLYTHTGISSDFPRRDVWRFGIGHQLQLMGTAHLDYLVVTLVGSADSEQSIQFTDARIVYSKD